MSFLENRDQKKSGRAVCHFHLKACLGVAAGVFGKPRQVSLLLGGVTNSPEDNNFPDLPLCVVYLQWISDSETE